MIMAGRRHDAGLEVLRDPEQAAALLDPGRRRLIAALRKQPDSAAGLARRLGESRQRLNYHLRALEEIGLIELQEERRRGNCTERVLRARARRFVVDPGAFGELAADPEMAGDRFSSTYLLALAARTIREVAELQGRAAETGKRLATAGWSGEVRLGRPADVESFVEDLTRAIAEAVARNDVGEGEGRPFRIVGGLHPAPEPEDS